MNNGKILIGLYIICALFFFATPAFPSPTISGPNDVSKSGAYAYTATGGIAPYNWTILPKISGISIDNNGQATLTNPVTSSYTVRVTDSNGDSAESQIRIQNAGGWQLESIVDEGCDVAGGYVCTLGTVRIIYYWTYIYSSCNDLGCGFCPDGPCPAAYDPRGPDYERKIFTVRYDKWVSTSNKTGNLGSGGSSDSAEANTGNAEISSPYVPNKICGASSIDLKSGNVYHSQQVGPLTFSYNSLDSSNGPLGIGWTHDFNILITTNSDGSLYMKSGDGNNTWYKYIGANIYKADAKSHDTATIEKNTSDCNGGTGYKRTTKYGKKYCFNSSGKLTDITDINGNAILLDYNGSGDLNRIYDSGTGRSITLYVQNGKINTISEQISETQYRSYEMTYNSNLITDIYDNSASPVTNWHFDYYDYTASTNINRMKSKRDPSGNTSNYEYYLDGKLKSVNDPSQKSKSISYQGDRTLVTEKDGGNWIHEYYGEFNVPLAITDPLGNKTTYTK